jgi:prephenate dehydrogenase
MESIKQKVTIIGTGNIGGAIAPGLSGIRARRRGLKAGK